MISIYTQEEVYKMHYRSERREASEKGYQKACQERDRLYGELLKQLVPLGRVDDILNATSDSSKLSALAEEFGLSVWDLSSINDEFIDSQFDDEEGGLIG